MEWKTPPPAALGSRVAFVAHLLGKRLAYTYEIVELLPEVRMVVRAAEGPFPMETTNAWEPEGPDPRTRLRPPLRAFLPPRVFFLVAFAIHDQYRSFRSPGNWAMIT